MSDPKEAVGAVIVGKWRTGFDRKSGYAVLIFEFDDRAPMPFVIPLSEATKIGTSLLNLNTKGVSSPAKLN